MHRQARIFIFSLLLWAARFSPAQGLPTDGAIAPAASGPVMAQPWTLSFIPLVHHWTDSPEHRRSFIVSLEKHHDVNQLRGLALFRNSFGQPSAYAYAAYHWHGILGEPRLSAKVSAGIMYGYTGKYEDKVPLNWNGFSPGLIPSLSYKLSQEDALQILLLGTAGFAMGYSRSF